MYDIPFILWFSKKYKSKFNEIEKISDYLNRKYILEDFPHTFADIIHTKFERYEPTKSILNKQFKEKDRIVIKNRNYDE